MRFSSAKASKLPRWLPVIRYPQFIPTANMSSPEAFRWVESHYLSKRSRRQPAILTFLAQDADSQVFCYSNADIRKGDEAEEIFRFIEFWKRQYGSLPQHLVFDSKLTTYDRLDRLDAAGITFITLRRRSPSLLAEIDYLPPSAWRTISLEISGRKHRTPRVYEQKARPDKRTFRQFFITDLGHDEPTILLTNDAKSTPKTIITRYAKSRSPTRYASSTSTRSPHRSASRSTFTWLSSLSPQAFTVSWVVACADTTMLKHARSSATSSTCRPTSQSPKAR
jgi:hypothetical protein